MTTWIASPTGTPDGDGSANSPWDLTTALEDKTATVDPGDTIYVRGGRCSVPDGIDVNLVGESGNPVIIKPYPGESVIIDGNRDGEAVKLIDILRFGDGSYVRLQGCRVTNSSTEERITDVDGSNADEARGAGINVMVPGIEIVNNVIDNCGGGLSAWSVGTEFKAYGNVIFDNGWKAPIRAHGHGIYVQSTDEKWIERNCIAHNFSYGLHAYAETGSLAHLRIKRNAFLPGTHLIGGKVPVVDCLFTENICQTPNFGYSTDTAGTGDVTITNNHIINQLKLTRLAGVTATGNFLYARNNTAWTVELSPLGDTDFDDYSFDSNTYWRNIYNSQNLWVSETSGLYNWTTWRALGHDANGTLKAGQVSAADDYTQLDINEYDDTRATLTLLNFSQADSVSVDLSDFADAGEYVRVRNAQNYFGDIAYAKGGTLTIDMRAASHSVSTPIGYTSALATTSFPTYGVFVLERLPAASGGWRGIIRKTLGWLVGDPTIPNPVPPAVVRRGWLTPGSPIRRSPSTDNPVRRA